MLYVPRHNRDDDPARIAALVREVGFGALVSTGPDGTPWATHVPFTVDTGADGAITGVALHLARANPHSRALDGADVLVIVQGPHAYVSATLHAPPESVSTWNYAAVHIRGRATLIDDMEAMRARVEALTRVYEDEAMLRAPGYDDVLLRRIVGLDIAVTSVEARVKMSQKESPETQARVVAHLAASPLGGDRDTAAMMQARGLDGTGEG